MGVDWAMTPGLVFKVLKGSVFQSCMLSPPNGKHIDHTICHITHGKQSRKQIWRIAFKHMLCLLTKQPVGSSSGLCIHVSGLALLFSGHVSKKHDVCSNPESILQQNVHDKQRLDTWWEGWSWLAAIESTSPRGWHWWPWPRAAAAADTCYLLQR